MMWELKALFLRAWCWLAGHDERMGNALNYEDDYCAKCYISWPQDTSTLPDLLNRLYVWIVERDWQWFERLDMWLCTHYGKVLPRWWSY